jgi:hypothetical protein
LLFKTRHYSLIQPLTRVDRSGSIWTGEAVRYYFTSQIDDTAAIEVSVVILLDLKDIVPPTTEKTAIAISIIFASFINECWVQVRYKVGLLGSRGILPDWE